MSDLAERIIEELDEPNAAFIRRLVAVAGEDLAARCLQETHRLRTGEDDGAAAGGPLLRRDGERRTPGGTFIYLMRGKMPPEQQRIFWPPTPRRPWRLVHALAAELREKEKGEATMEIELTGRPQKLATRKGIVSAQFVTEPDEEAIPQGLPMPPDRSLYLVLMEQKTYEPVAAAVKEGKRLQVRGYCHIQAEKGYGLVLAREVTAVQ